MVTWKWTSFVGLSVDELYAVLWARQAVFIVEQQSIYPDIDGLDKFAWHLLGHTAEADTQMLAAYLRVVFPGKKYAEPSIGRVLTIPAARGQGWGQALMAEGIQRVETHYPNRAIRISAQQYLERFYQGFGFQTMSEPYDDAGVLHLDMLRPAAQPSC